MKRYDMWREFVFELLTERLATIMAVVDEVVFQRMDCRVAAWLLKHNIQSASIRMTLQEITSELGSSREVISRILEDFSKTALISIGRGTLELIDKDELENLTVM